MFFNLNTHILSRSTRRYLNLKFTYPRIAQWVHTWVVGVGLYTITQLIFHLCMNYIQILDAAVLIFSSFLLI